MKKCPFCAEEIQDAAIVCKHCGRDLVPTREATPQKKDSKGWGLLAWCFGLIVLLFVVGVSLTYQKSRTANISPERIDAANRIVDQMRSTKMLVKFDCYGIHDAYVNPLLWAALDHEQKRGVTMALSLNCVSIGEPQFVHVKDNMTGKEIAQFYGGVYRLF